MPDLRPRRGLVIQDDSDRSEPRSLDMARTEDFVFENDRKAAEAAASLGMPMPGGSASVIDMKEKPVVAKRRHPLEAAFWIAACCLILYFGDGDRSFLYATIKDPKINKKAFYFACLCSLINCGIIFHLAVIVRLIWRDPRHFDHAAPGALSAGTLLGIMAYILYTVALWPIFGPIILVELWCFFMGMVVLASYIPTNAKPNPKYFRNAAETPYTQ